MIQEIDIKVKIEFEGKMCNRFCNGLNDEYSSPQCRYFFDEEGLIQILDMTEIEINDSDILRCQQCIDKTNEG